MRLAVSAATLVWLAAVTSADAQVVGRHRGTSSSQSIAYSNGYREGIDHGQRDARAGRDYAIEHDNTYRRADEGYKRQYGDRDMYRQTFRQGYVAGYNEGYYGGSGARGRAVPRRNPGTGSPGTYPLPYPTYPGSQGYPSYPSYPGYPGSPAGAPYGYGGGPLDTGFADGYEKGVEDGRDGDAYDPLRHSRYRSADRGYDRRFGSRDEYKNVYREGFRQGYERGYREARTYGGRNQNRWGRSWPWVF